MVKGDWDVALVLRRIQMVQRHPRRAQQGEFYVCVRALDLLGAGS